MSKNKLNVNNTFFININAIKERERGELYYLDRFEDLSFKIERVYWVTNVNEGKVRGNHAHKKTNQILICINGSVRVSMDDGMNRKTIILNNPKKALFLSNKVWHSIKYLKSNTILLVLASKKYEEKDYIRNYEKFISYLAK